MWVDNLHQIQKIRRYYNLPALILKWFSGPWIVQESERINDNSPNAVSLMFSTTTKKHFCFKICGLQAGNLIYSDVLPWYFTKVTAQRNKCDCEIDLPCAQKCYPSLEIGLALKPYSQPSFSLKGSFIHAKNQSLVISIPAHSWIQPPTLLIKKIVPELLEILVAHLAALITAALEWRT